MDLHETHQLNFAEALIALQHGQLMTRLNWNGKGQFVFMRPADELEIGFIINTVKSLPKRLKEYYAVKDAKEMPSEQGLEKIKFSSYFCLKSADGSIINGWIPSTTDLQARDWGVFKF